MRLFNRKNEDLRFDLNLTAVGLYFLKITQRLGLRFRQALHNHTTLIFNQAYELERKIFKYSVIYSRWSL